MGRRARQFRSEDNVPKPALWVCPNFLGSAVSKYEQRGWAVVRPRSLGRSTGPDRENKPLVEVGDTVAVGQVLCVIDVGGQLNEIESEVSVEIAGIHVSTRSHVEINAPLFEIRVKG